MARNVQTDAPQRLGYHFGRISIQPDDPLRQAVFARTNLPVNTVLTYCEGLGPRGASRALPMLRPDDITAARAFEVSHRPVQPSAPLGLLLDENVSYLATHKLAQCFGYATHVQAMPQYKYRRPGERSVPDEEVFAYALQNQLAIVSMDNDLLQLTRSHVRDNVGCDTFTPLLIRPRHGQDRYRMEHEICRHRQELLELARQSRYAYVNFTEEGLRPTPLLHDERRGAQKRQAFAMA